MNKAARAVILGEDLQQRVFVRRMLVEIGYPRHRIHEIALPSGAGAGEAYVRGAYAENVRAHRRCAARMQAVLVVMIDADTAPVQRRRDQLAEALADAQVAQPKPGEAIALLIPRRNIETWIWHLRGEQVDEQTVYPKLAGREAECQSAVERFVALRASPATRAGLPSLDEGIIESRRLP